MGWKNGQRVADDVWDAIEAFLPDDVRREAAEALIEVFEEHGGKMENSVLWDEAERDSGEPELVEEEEDDEEPEEDEDEEG